jgi:hypothetical protein
MCGYLELAECCDQDESAGSRQVDQPGEGMQTKPIPPSTVKEVFNKWVADHVDRAIPLAHDGMRNIYSPEMLLPANEDEKWTTVEIPSGRKRPHVYMCALLSALFSF